MEGQDKLKPLQPAQSGAVAKKFKLKKPAEPKIEEEQSETLPEEEQTDRNLTRKILRFLGQKLPE